LLAASSTSDGRTDPVAVLGETDALIAVGKPAHLLIHPTKPGGPRTLWDELRELLSYELATGGGISIINRLDRETSGAVLVAKSSAAARECVEAMTRGEIQKSYLAIVMGWPDADGFVIDAPLRRAGEFCESEIWLKRAVHPDGSPARTEAKVLFRGVHPAAGPVSLVRATPRTGRTHQIRVHLAHAGFPIVGDKIYGPDERLYLQFIETGWTPELAARLHLDRHALHSAEIGLTFRDEAFRWEAPLPADLKEFLERAGH